MISGVEALGDRVSPSNCSAMDSMEEGNHLEQTNIGRRRFCFCLHVTQPVAAGQNVLLYGTLGKQFPKAMLVGPDFACSFFTVALIISVSLFWLAKVAFDFALWAGLLGILSTVGALIPFCITAWSDPGIVERRLEFPVRELDRGRETSCDRCKIYRKFGTQHCTFCDVCIEDLDHHCPWTGKCIGSRTKPYFNAFLGFLVVHISFIILTVFLWGARLNR